MDKKIGRRQLLRGFLDLAQVSQVGAPPGEALIGDGRCPAAQARDFIAGFQQGAGDRFANAGADPGDQSARHDRLPPAR
ncbi:hypothetical protein D3C74_451240 [compost metagenome]